MNVEQVREYSLSLPGATEDMPYGDDMVVFRIEGKIFLHLPLEYADPRMVIKLPPEKGLMLREQYDAVSTAWHFDKKHWNQVLVDGYFDDDQLRAWIDESYSLVLAKLPKYIQKKYLEQ